MKIEIYTDGACSGNPGKGGYGVVLKARDIHLEKTLSKGFRKTTNNRMELLAVIIALEQIKTTKLQIDIYTDSKYVADAINQRWLSKWIKRGFKNVKNIDLWKRFIPLYEKFSPRLHWIKGHNGHPENERCDQLAIAAANSTVLDIDTGYEELSDPSNLFHQT